MSLRLKFNLVLAAVFVLGLVASMLVVAHVAEQNAREQLRQQIAILSANALALRRYTADEIRPLLSDASEVQFLPQTVPSFSARTAFTHFRERFPAFKYKETALNPTNPANAAADWERALIKRLRADRALTEIVKVRTTPDGEHFTMAFPLAVTSKSCLSCHANPGGAPKSMVAVYGDKNGFGWKLDEVVGAQIISVPMAEIRDGYRQTIQLFAIALGAIFLVLLALLNVLLSRMVISPITKMAQLAEAVSMGDSDAPEYVLSGSDEIASLSQSFTRMRRSLDNAMKMLKS